MSIHRLIKTAFYILHFILPLFSANLCAVDIAPLKAHLKVQHQYFTHDDDSLASITGFQHIQSTSFDTRLLLQANHHNWRFASDYQLVMIHGNTIEQQLSVSSLFPSLMGNLQQQQWFDLEHDLHNGKQTTIRHRLDRLYISYSNDYAVFKLGRQALSWGNGVVFRPMDIFNPFAPDAIDSSYKPGIDMLYAQLLLDNGGDLSGVLVPRRQLNDQQLDNAVSSSALKWYMPRQNHELQLMIAKDYDDDVIGSSITGSVAQAIWRFELVTFFLQQGGSRSSLVLNIDNSWNLAGKNIYGLLEYYRNGFGSAQTGLSMQQWSKQLVDRLARGQVYNTGRDYLATLVRIEWTPLLQLSPLMLFNLNDHSALINIQGSYAFKQDMNLNFGISTGLGTKDTEYGGAATSVGSDVYNSPPASVYCRLEMYF